MGNFRSIQFLIFRNFTRPFEKRFDPGKLSTRTSSDSETSNEAAKRVFYRTIERKLRKTGRAFEENFIRYERRPSF
uniref:Uncharacterized protein n=1 Tax=Leptospira ellisii TaxID=2023197 RepID=A0A2N0B9B8_9LEPT|nr:hypothetical protein CH379_09305 [Leptospira ellisii]